MVPVMITAPSVIWASAKSAGAWVGSSLSSVGGVFRRRRAVTPEGVEVEVEIPDDVDSAARYIHADSTGLVETERNGVTIVSRQAAE